MPHQVEGAIDQSLYVARFGGTGVAGLGDDSGFAAVGREARERDGCRVGGVGLDDDVIETEGEGHGFRVGIELRFAGFGPVGVAAQVFVEIAAMQIDDVIGFVDHLRGHGGGNAFGLRSIGLAGVHAVQAFAIDGVDVRDLLREGSDVQERQDDERAGHCSRVGGLAQLFKRKDGGIFGAVRAGDKSERGAWLRAVDYDDRDIGGGVSARGNPDDARDALAGARGGSADGEVGGADGEGKSEEQRGAVEHGAFQSSRFRLTWLEAGASDWFRRSRSLEVVEARVQVCLAGHGYSLSTAAGSTFSARRAGRMQAVRPTMAKRRTTEPITTGSSG